MDRVIVSGADAGYQPLLASLHASLIDRGLLRNAAFGVVDGGLAPAQRQTWADRGAIVADVNWGIDFPLRAAVDAGQPGMRVMAAKPQLPKLFPGFSTYLWIDADAWVQSADAVELLFACAASGRLAAVMEIDRAYRSYWSGMEAWVRFRTWYAAAFDDRMGSRMAVRPMINTGVFALPATADLWGRWAALHRQILVNQQKHLLIAFLAEQLALNVAVHLDGAPFVPLPSRCNWMCNLALPAWDRDQRLLCEPMPPHEPLGIVHLADQTKREAQAVLDRARRPLRLHLTYPPRPARSEGGQAGDGDPPDDR